MGTSGSIHTVELIITKDQLLQECLISNDRYNDLQGQMYKKLGGVINSKTPGKSDIESKPINVRTRFHFIRFTKKEVVLYNYNTGDNFQKISISWKNFSNYMKHENASELYTDPSSNVQNALNYLLTDDSFSSYLESMNKKEGLAVVYYSMGKANKAKFMDVRQLNGKAVYAKGKGILKASEELTNLLNEPGVEDIVPQRTELEVKQGDTGLEKLGTYELVKKLRVAAKKRTPDEILKVLGALNNLMNSGKMVKFEAFYLLNSLDSIGKLLKVGFRKTFSNDFNRQMAIFKDLYQTKYEVQVAAKPSPPTAGEIAKKPADNLTKEFKYTQISIENLNKKSIDELINLAIDILTTEGFDNPKKYMLSLKGFYDPYIDFLLVLEAIKNNAINVIRPISLFEKSKALGFLNNVVSEIPDAYFTLSNGKFTNKFKQSRRKEIMDLAADVSNNIDQIKNMQKIVVQIEEKGADNLDKVEKRRRAGAEVSAEKVAVVALEDVNEVKVLTQEDLIEEGEVVVFTPLPYAEMTMDEARTIAAEKLIRGDTELFEGSLRISSKDHDRIVSMIKAHKNAKDSGNQKKIETTRSNILQFVAAAMVLSKGGTSPNHLSDELIILMYEAQLRDVFDFTGFSAKNQRYGWTAKKLNDLEDIKQRMKTKRGKRELISIFQEWEIKRVENIQFEKGGLSYEKAMAIADYIEKFFPENAKKNRLKPYKSGTTLDAFRTLVNKIRENGITNAELKDISKIMRKSVDGWVGPWTLMMLMMTEEIVEEAEAPPSPSPVKVRSAPRIILAPPLKLGKVAREERDISVVGKEVLDDGNVVNKNVDTRALVGTTHPVFESSGDRLSITDKQKYNIYYYWFSYRELPADLNGKKQKVHLIVNPKLNKLDNYVAVIKEDGTVVNLINIATDDNGIHIQTGNEVLGNLEVRETAGVLDFHLDVSKIPDMNQQAEKFMDVCTISGEGALFEEAAFRNLVHHPPEGLGTPETEQRIAVAMLYTRKNLGGE